MDPNKRIDQHIGFYEMIMDTADKALMQLYKHKQDLEQERESFRHKANLSKKV